MSNSEPRELSSPVQLYPATTEPKGSPVRFLGPKDATAPKPAKRRTRTSTKKASKPSSNQEPQSASTAEESSSTPAPKVTPTQIPESDS